MQSPTSKLWRSVPDGLRVPVDILRRRRYWKNAGAIFIHVPKTAGVSLSRALYGRTLGHFYATDVRRICPNSFRKLLTFGAVRHPVTRLYSAYEFARKGGTSEMGMRRAHLYRSSSFNTFDRFVCEWLAKQEMQEIDGVFKPQHWYLCDGDEVVVDLVVKLEQIDVGIRELARLLGREIAMGHFNQTQSSELLIQSPETLTVIQQLYQKDFEIFSYLPKAIPS